MPEIDPAWLPDRAWRAIGARRTAVAGEGPLVDTVRDEVAGAAARYGGSLSTSGPADLVLSPSAADGELGPEGFTLARAGGVTSVRADGEAGLLYGLFQVVRLGEAAFAGDLAREVHRPMFPRRMLDHWDNV